MASVESINDNQIQLLLGKLKADLDEFPNCSNYLAMQLESAAKHLPSYVKIVKTHIEQLKTVLAMNSHNNRSIESIPLDKSVEQLMAMFKDLNNDDIALIDKLAIESRNWLNKGTSEVTENSTTTVAEEHS